jgi:hypothetical protein
LAGISSVAFAKPIVDLHETSVELFALEASGAVKADDNGLFAVRVGDEMANEQE